MPRRVTIPTTGVNLAFHFSLLRELRAVMSSPQHVARTPSSKYRQEIAFVLVLVSEVRQQQQ